MPRRQNPAMLFVFLLIVLVVIWYLHSRSQSSGRASSPNGEISQAHVGPPDIYPDAARTPGAVNADITQENIHDTICNPGWSTRSIRPEASYTTRLKGEQIQEYGYPDISKRDYEEDHFIPLELGGNPTDPKNLWPEPYSTSIADGGAHAKDKVENYLHAEVCSGSLTLDQAQHEITEDWYRVYKQSVPH
jgi:hypothetical protein